MSPRAITEEAEEQRYRELIGRVRERICECIPRDGKVLVISHGDERFLRVEGRESGHYPQSSTGLYAGHYPAEGAEARAHLVDLRDRGAEYLVIPATSRWWLDHYTELAEALGEGELLLSEPETCDIFALQPRRTRQAPISPAKLAAARAAPQLARLLEALLPPRAGVLVVGPGVATIDMPERDIWTLDTDRDEVWTRQEAEDELSRARSSGARYLVVLRPADTRRWPDERLTAALVSDSRKLCSQRLADCYELATG